MESSSEPRPEPEPQAAPKARPSAAPDSLGPRIADSYTELPKPPAQDGRAALWAGLAALAALGLLAAKLLL